MSSASRSDSQILADALAADPKLRRLHKRLLGAHETDLEVERVHGPNISATVNGVDAAAEAHKQIDKAIRAKLRAERAMTIHVDENYSGEERRVLSAEARRLGKMPKS